jgi:N-acyl-D-aspartate/D-glutamate deacylase
MEGVEDIPFPVLTEGLPWNWESFPSYLDALSARRFDIDLGAQLPHAALRVFVMGERGANREPATAADITAMAGIAQHAVQAGALGFSTSRTLNHRTSDGQPTPTLTAGEDELTGIAMALRQAGAGVLQVVSDFTEPLEEFAMLRRMVQASGRPLSFSLVQSPFRPQGYKALLAALDDAVAAGLPMAAQVAPRPVGVLLGLELTMNPFSFHPAYAAIAKAPFADRVARLRDPDFRAQLLSDAPAGPFRGLVGNFANMYAAHGTPDYEPLPEHSIAAVAARRGVTPQQLALDYLLTQDGRAMLYVPLLNYAEFSLDPAYAMLIHPHTVPGLSDGGAHVGMICDGSFPTSLLTHWTRDRTRGPKLDIATAVRMQSRDTAAAIGLADRGVLRAGLRADINVIDYGRLALHAPQVVYDLPAGGRRLIQRASGYEATLVAGAITYRDGEPTGALPGRLVRGEQVAQRHAA